MRSIFFIFRHSIMTFSMFFEPFFAHITLKVPSSQIGSARIRTLHLVCFDRAIIRWRNSVSDQIQNLPNCFTTPNKMTSEDGIKRLVSLKFLRPCCTFMNSSSGQQGSWRGLYARPNQNQRHGNGNLLSLGGTVGGRRRGPGFTSTTSRLPKSLQAVVRVGLGHEDGGLGPVVPLPVRDGGGEGLRRAVQHQAFSWLYKFFHQKNLNKNFF